MKKPVSSLKEANTFFREKKYNQAIPKYIESINKKEIPEEFIKFNIKISTNRLISLIKKNNEANSHERSEIFNNYIEKIIKETPEGFRLATALAFQKQTANKEEKPLVSIIMPTWNRGFIIHEAINSVIDQYYSNWELIICDDASNDNTENIVLSYKDKRIKYFKLKKGNGAIARNHGLKFASGEIVAFLDSDNIWSPAYLEKIITQHNNENNIVYTGFIDTIIDNDTFTSAETKFKEFDYLKIAHRNYIDLNTLSFKSSLIDQLGCFDPSLPRQQDWDLLIRYTAHCTPFGLNEPLVLYRRNKDWDQVTETKKHIDTRSIVMRKNAHLAEAYKKRELPLRIDQLSRSIKSKSKKIAIKISAPNEVAAFEWGDYHFAHQLGAALYKYGWDYVVNCQDTWYSESSDINIVLRGRHRFFSDKSDATLNIAWLISHPDRLAKGELDDYDHIYIASDIFVEKAQKVTRRPVSSLHQATDPSVFKPSLEKIKLPEDIVFIGNSRNEYRRLVKWSVEQDISIALWGSNWENFVPRDMIVASYISNSELSIYYSSCKILLNDHWDTMKSNGFISNRIFDASAAGAFIITDGVLGLEQIFGDTIEIANSADDLKKKINYYLNNQAECQQKALKAREIVLESHTFDNRAKEINNLINKLNKKYSNEI